MSIAFIQLGQCGNQIGHALFDFLVSEYCPEILKSIKLQPSSSSPAERSLLCGAQTKAGRKVPSD